MRNALYTYSYWVLYEYQVPGTRAGYTSLCVPAGTVYELIAMCAC